MDLIELIKFFPLIKRQKTIYFPMIWGGNRSSLIRWNSLNSRSEICQPFFSLFWNAFNRLQCRVSLEAVIYGTKYSRAGQVKFLEDSLLKNLKGYGLLMIFYKGCYRQMLLGRLLNILSHILLLICFICFPMFFTGISTFMILKFFES